MIPFRNYSEHEAGLPVVSYIPSPDSPSLYDKNYRDEVNAELAEITDVNYSWPQAGLEAIASTLNDHGLHLPDFPLDDTGEEVLLIKNPQEVVDPEAPKKMDLFLYLYHEVPTDADEQCEFYAEIVNENELEELLEELNDDGEEYENADGTRSYDDEDEDDQDEYNTDMYEQFIKKRRP